MEINVEGWKGMKNLIKSLEDVSAENYVIYNQLN